MSFSAVTAHILRAAGWHPERHVDPSAWLGHIQAAGYDTFDLLESTLAHLGGMFIDPMPFHLQPFTLDNGQEVILNDWFSAHRIDLRPDVSDEIWSADTWKAIQYVQRRRLQIAPLGSIWYPGGPRQTMFLLSDGSVMGGILYQPEPTWRAIFGLDNLGDSVYDALNALFQEDAMYR